MWFMKKTWRETATYSMTLCFIPHLFWSVMNSCLLLKIETLFSVLSTSKGRHLICPVFSPYRGIDTHFLVSALTHCSSLDSGIQSPEQRPYTIFFHTTLSNVMVACNSPLPLRSLDEPSLATFSQAWLITVADVKGGDGSYFVIPYQWDDTNVSKKAS